MIMILFYSPKGDFYMGLLVLWISHQNTCVPNLNDIGMNNDLKAQLFLQYDIPSVISSIIRHLLVCIAWHRIYSDGHGGE